MVMGRLDISTAVAYALDIARGMNYLHQHKPHAIVHRDLTPRGNPTTYLFEFSNGNVLQDEAGRPKAQAERLVGEIHVNELELEKLNTVRRHLENGNVETNAARNRFGRITVSEQRDDVAASHLKLKHKITDAIRLVESTSLVKLKHSLNIDDVGQWTWILLGNEEQRVDQKGLVFRITTIIGGLPAGERVQQTVATKKTVG
ncbi:hypothetical protein ACLOJK_026101 [Asimina triloba]